MSVARIKDLPSPENLQGVPEIREYLERLYAALQEEQSERIEDFDQLKLDNVPYVDVRTYGLVAGDNSSAVMTKNVAGWNTLIAAVTAGTEIYFPKGIWYINDDLDVSQSVTIRGDGVGSEIQQEVDSKRGFNVSVNNVTIRDLKLKGNGAPAQGSAAKSDSDAIQILGTAAGGGPTNLVNVKVIDCFIENWGEYGILADYLDNFEFSGNYIKTIKYAGILGLCVQDGVISNNRIDDIKGIQNTNAYGISLTRHTSGGLTEHPRSARIAIVNNIVTNVLTWDGISTHGAEDCFFNNNIVKNTNRGINVVHASPYAGINNTISNNIVELGGVSPDDAASGIGMAGYDADNLATGCIVGNIIVGHGAHDDSAAISGGLSIKFTQGIVVTGNRLINPQSRGIQIYQNNYDFTVSGNTISNVWSAHRSVMAIQVNSVNNIGYIGENSWANVTEDSGNYLGSGTSYGIYIGDHDGVTISLGDNHSKDADTAIADPGSKVAVRGIVSPLTITGLVTLTGDINQKRAGNYCKHNLDTFATDPAISGSLYLRKSNSNTLGTLAATDNGDRLGTIFFQSVRSANDLMTSGAYIRATQNGAAGTYIPTDLKFVTYTSSGSDISLVLGTGGGVSMPSLKAGTDQANAGASENELYVDTNDDNTIKLGAST